MPSPDTVAGARLLGESLRTRRKQRHLTQRDVCAQTGLSLATIVSVENARRLPSLASLATLAAAYETTTVELLSGIYPWDFPRRTGLR